MDLASLQSLLNRATDVTVACIGDLMLDRYVMGTVARISPEAPIPVLRRTAETEMAGAVGNVARNVVAMGARARLISAAGDDAAGRALEALLKAEPGIDLRLRLQPGHMTTVKTRFVAGGHQLLRLDAERGQPVDDLEVDAMEGADAVLLSDYAKGLVTDAVIARAVGLADRGIPVIVDPKGRDFARYGTVTLLKPNASELSAAVEMPVSTDVEVEAALARALALFPAKAILATRAAQGLSIAERGQPIRHVRARPREVFDVSGAGDTSLAALGLAMATGADLEAAAALAILASGVVIAKQGAATATSAELIDAELRTHATPTFARVRTPTDLADEVRAWQAEGLKVGFTNGCFDILHRGHVAYLEQAKAWCDRLVVALNSDASVSALKGPGRPINDIDARAAVIAGLASVDRVTTFADPTPLALIERLRPDVLIKGADYAEADVVGAAQVTGWGGEVRLAPFVEGYSTTKTLARGAPAASS